MTNCFFFNGLVNVYMYVCVRVCRCRHCVHRNKCKCQMRDVITQGNHPAITYIIAGCPWKGSCAYKRKPTYAYIAIDGPSLT